MMTQYPKSRNMTHTRISLNVFNASKGSFIYILFYFVHIISKVHVGSIVVSCQQILPDWPGGSGSGILSTRVSHGSTTRGIENFTILMQFAIKMLKNSSRQRSGKGAIRKRTEVGRNQTNNQVLIP